MHASSPWAFCHLLWFVSDNDNIACVADNHCRVCERIDTDGDRLAPLLHIRLESCEVSREDGKDRQSDKFSAKVVVVSLALRTKLVRGVVVFKIQ